MIKQILPDLREIAFAYDAAGNLRSITPAGRPAHTFHYSGVNLATSYVPPALADGGGTAYIYNVDRDLEQIVRPDGTSIAFGYDTGGRLLSITAPDASRTYGYHESGNLASISGADANLSYSYDGSLPTEMSWTGTVSGRVAWTYDADVRLGSESVGESAVAFTYDDDGLLESAGEALLARGADGILDYAQVGATTETFQLDAHGELDVLLHQDAHPLTGTPRTLMSTDYTRDAAGRITGLVETVNGADLEIGYHYDPAGRLDTVTTPSAIVRYTYDANGNRIAREIIGPSATTVETASYDSQDRLLNYEGTQYTYTPNDDLLTKADTTGTTHYTYDTFGNLLSVTLPSGTPIDYLIDAQNRRVGRKVDGVITHRWLYSDQLRILAELDSTGAVTKRFVYGSRAHVPDYMIAGGITYRIYADHLGSPRMVVNLTTGVVVQAMRFDEFGYVLADTNPGFVPFGFAGGLYDVTTGLVRFGARDYDARVGRWTAKEPLGFGGDDPNFYAHAINDPINLADSDGLKTYPANFVGPLQSGDTRSYAANLNDPRLAPLQYPTYGIAPIYYYPAGTPANLRQECVSLTEAFSGAPCTACWRAGLPAVGGNLPAGTAIATFVSGRYPQGDVAKNSGIYLSPSPNGIVIIDQWPGNLARAREVRSGGGPGRSNDANAYSQITVPAGECGCGSN